MEYIAKNLYEHGRDQIHIERKENAFSIFFLHSHIIKN